jgi:hypothetical protein
MLNKVNRLKDHVFLFSRMTNGRCLKGPDPPEAKVDGGGILIFAYMSRCDGMTVRLSIRDVLMWIFLPRLLPLIILLSEK